MKLKLIVLALVALVLPALAFAQSKSWDTGGGYVLRPAHEKKLVHLKLPKPSWPKLNEDEWLGSATVAMEDAHKANDVAWNKYLYDCQNYWRSKRKTYEEGEDLAAARCPSACTMAPMPFIAHVQTICERTGEHCPGGDVSPERKQLFKAKWAAQVQAVRQGLKTHESPENIGDELRIAARAAELAFTKRYCGAKKNAQSELCADNAAAALKKKHLATEVND